MTDAKRILLGTKTRIPVLVHLSTALPAGLTLALSQVLLAGFLHHLSCPFHRGLEGTATPQLKLSRAGEHCSNHCSSSSRISCSPFCSPEQRTLVKTKNPNLPHAPSSPFPLPSPGMAKLLKKLLKNHSEHFPCPKRFSSKNLF